jgi:outer membrane protein assembly factor BamB
MEQSHRRSSGRGLMVVIVALLVVFVALAAYQKFQAEHNRFASDRELQAELDGARLIDQPAEAPTAEWPQWRGARRDGVAFCPDFLTEWPARGPARLWQADGAEGYSSFAVADGRAYTMLRDGGQEVVLCLDAANGNELWRFSYECGYEDHMGGRGPRSTPSVDGDRVYTVGASGMFHCLTAAKGEKLWHHDLLAEFNAPRQQWGVAFSPLVEGDLVYTTPGGPNGNSLAAFDKKTGKLAWKALDDPAGYSSPVGMTVAGVRQIVYFTGDSAVGVAPSTGALYWRFPWPTSHNVNAATPIVFKVRQEDRELDYVFISSGYNQGCALLKIHADGKGGFEARRVYESNQMCSHFSSPVRRGEYVYGFNEAKLTCMDLRTGKVAWEQSGFNKGSLVVVGDYLVVLGEGGKLALVKATPEEYYEVATAQVFRKRCWTVPVLAEGKLFLRDEDHILCLKATK